MIVIVVGVAGDEMIIEFERPQSYKCLPSEDWSSAKAYFGVYNLVRT